MLLVDSMKREDDRFVLGATSAVISGSLVAFVVRQADFAGELLDEPLLLGIGLFFAGLGGGILARRVIGVPWMDALANGILLGLLVPVATGGIVATIFAPIGMIVGTIMWPATVPAGLLWTVIVRGLADRPTFDQAARGVLALALSLALLAVRYTQPAWRGPIDGLRCLSFPGEDIASIAWTPDGSLLAIGSMPSYDEGVIRLLDPRTGTVHELARGPAIVPEYGRLAVGPNGTTYYMEPRDVPLDFEPGDPVPPSEVFVVSRGAAPRHYTWVPALSIRDWRYTTDGIAGVLTWDPQTDEHDIDRLVWIDEGASADDRLREVSLEEAGRHPTLAPLIRPDDASLTVLTPNGTRVVQRPGTFGDVRTSADGTSIVYPLTINIGGEYHDEIHVISIETGRQHVHAVELEVDDAHMAGGSLAYRTTEYDSNKLCVVPVADP